MKDENSVRSHSAQGNTDKKPCTKSTVLQAIARNITYHIGAGVGLGGKLFGFLNVEAFHAYGGFGGDLDDVTYFSLF